MFIVMLLLIVMSDLRCEWKNTSCRCSLSRQRSRCRDLDYE